MSHVGYRLIGHRATVLSVAFGHRVGVVALRAPIAPCGVLFDATRPAPPCQDLAAVVDRSERAMFALSTPAGG